MLWGSQLRGAAGSSRPSHAQPQPQQQQDSAPTPARSPCSTPRLGFLSPRLYPPQYESQFWSSEFTQRVFRDKDNQTACIHIFHDILFLLRFCALVPRPADRTMRAVAVTMVVLTLLHTAMRFLVPYEYKSCRWVLVVHRRMFYAIGFISNLEAISDVASSRTITREDADSLFSYQLVQGSSRMSTLRNLLIGSGAAWNLIHALPFTLPFPLEILLQAVYFCATFQYLAPLGAAFFSAPPYIPGFRTLCHTISSATQPPWTPLLPPAAPPHICDTPRTAWVLVLFTQVFAGFTLTLYLTFFFERHLKLRFLQHLRDTQPAPAQPLPHQAPLEAPRAHPASHTHPTTDHTTPAAHTPADQAPQQALPSTSQAAGPTAPAAATASHTLTQGMPGSNPQQTLLPRPYALPRALQLPLSLCKHALRLWLLAAVAWQLVLAVHQPMARLVKAVDFEGGSLVWYWELMCGGDRWPCCPSDH